MKKMSIAVIAVLAFVVGYMLPRQNGLNQDQECKVEMNRLKKDQGYKAGPYTVYYLTYKGRGGKIYHKIDINGKHNLIGGIYKEGATIEEKK